jgi:hypothetical protein
MPNINNVSQPPLNAPMIISTGMPSMAWSNWFRDLYRRTAYKGGNAIDDNLADLEALTLLVEKNIVDIAALDVRVTQNEIEIILLQDRVTELEYRVFDVVIVAADITLEEFKIAVCKNTTPIEVTLKASPVLGDEIQIKRSDAEVTVIGLIDGVSDLIINVPNYSLYLVFNGTDWSAI